jgi:dihydroneopterin aldolase
LAAQFTIELKGLRFFAEHGLYPEEQLIGNEFEVDVAIHYQAPERITSIKETINYVDVFHIVKENFMKRQQLLETCALQIAGKLQEHFPQISQLTISIRKLNPPISNFTGSVGFTYTTPIISQEGT